METARKVLGLPASLPENAAIDAAIVEAVAQPGSGIPVVADATARDARFPSPNGDQLAQVKALGYVQRFDQSVSAWRSELVTGGAGPLVRAVSKGAIGNGAADDGAAVQAAHDTAGATGEAELSGGVYRVAGTRSFANGLTIRRGAQLKAALNAVLTLGPLAAGHHQVFDTTEAAPGAVVFAEGAVTEVKAEWFGWAPNATGIQNRTALRWALKAVPVSGGRVTFGPHTVTLDVNDADGGVRILRDNVSFNGAGFGRSVIQYSSASSPAVGGGAGDLGHGSAFLLCDQAVSHKPDKIGFFDFTLQDTNTVDATGTGHYPAAIDGIKTISVEVGRMEFIDVKGNGALTILGDAANDTTAGTGDYLIYDCIFRGTPGKGIQRDATNVSGMNRLFYERNRHFGGIGAGFFLGHGLELGTGIGELYVRDNYFDMQGVGLGCVASFTILRRGVISGNEFLNWSNATSAIPINPDISTQPINGLVIENNRFYGNTSSLGAVSTQDGVIQGLIVQGNYFECIVPISLARIPQGVTRITKNTARWTAGAGNVFVVNSGFPAFLNSSDILEISHNTLQGRTNLLAVDFTQWQNGASNTIKDARMRGLHTNTIQNPKTGQIDGQNDADFGLPIAVADGAVSAAFTATILGALPGDRVRVVRRATNRPPDGVFLFAEVDGAVADRVNVFYLNKSGAPYGGGGQFDVRLTVERS